MPAVRLLVATKGQAPNTIYLGEDGETLVAKGAADKQLSLATDYSGFTFNASASDASRPVHTVQDTTWVVTPADRFREVRFVSSQPITLRIPSQLSVELPLGLIGTYRQDGAGQITVVGDAGVMVSSPSGSLTSSGATIKLEKVGSQNVRVTGSTSPDNGVSSTVMLLPGVGSATANTVLLQAALNRGGYVRVTSMSPLVYTNNTLSTLPGGKTHIQVDRNLTIRQAPNTNKQMLVSAGFLSPPATPVTLAWTSGRDVTVTWNAHGRAIGDYVYLSGASKGVYRGVFPVSSVVDANNFTVKLEGTPLAAPAAASGDSLRASVADTDITIEGGIWDYDFANNAGAATALARQAIIMQGVARLRVRNAVTINALKYCWLLVGVTDYVLENLSSDTTNSDFIKIYGPAYNGKVSHLRARPGDDFLTLQPREADPYAAYRVDWGDIRGFRGEDFHSTGQTVAGLKIFGIYTTIDATCDGVYVDGIDGDTSGYAAIVTPNANAANNGNEIGTSMGSIEVRRVTALSPLAQVRLGDSTIDKAVINVSDVRTTGTAARSLETTSGNYTKHLVLDNFRLTDTNFGGAGTAQVLILANGQFDQMDLVNPVVQGGSLSRLMTTSVTGAGQGVINVTGGVQSAGDNFIIINGNPTGTPKVNIRNVKTATAAVLGIGSTVTNPVDITINGCDMSGATNGVLRLAGTGVHTFSGTGNMLRSGSWVVSPSGTPQIGIQSPDVRVDVTAAYVARRDGGTLYNTNAAAGTLGVAGVVDGLGTAAGSWRLRGDPTKSY